jgi:chemotaxis protein CheD
MGVAGLAHVVLPESGGLTHDNPRKFADLAIPELLAQLAALGARRVRLDAVLVGGASMFAGATESLEVGQRNEAAVRAHLRALRIPIAGTATGGSKGRTIRVDVAAATVTVREAGGREELLLGDRAAVAA